MFVKMLGADGRSHVTYDYVSSYVFHEREDAPGDWVTLTQKDGVTQALVEGPVFVMNDLGNTVDKFVGRKAPKK